MKNNDIELWIEMYCIAAVIVIVLSTAIAIVTATYQYSTVPESQPSVRNSNGPPIERCDKELWDRITRGCKQ